MKLQIQDPLQIGREALPRGRMTSWLRLPVFIVLGLLGLGAALRLKAGVGDPLDNLSDVFEGIATMAVASDSSDPSPVEIDVTGFLPEGYLDFLFVPPQPLRRQIRQASASGSSAAGTLYGTAFLGGSFGFGTVFAVDSNGTNFTVLHHFHSSDGANPSAGLILSSNTLYGTTVNGGNVDDGTVFALDTNGTNFRVLHHFSARNHEPYTNSDGGNPYAALVVSGNMLYGTASDGGTANNGTVFALNVNNTNFTVLHSFAAAQYDSNFNLTNSDGAAPVARLLLSGDTLYGTASGGGTGGAGTVFAVNTNGTNFNVLHGFAAVDPLTRTNTDGVSPQAGLILSSDTLYGTAFRGGNSTLGTVFAVNTHGAFFTNLYSFTGGSDGAEPASELVLFNNALFGTASSGGDSALNNGGNGTVFALNTNGAHFTVFHRFTAGNYDASLIGSALTNSDGATPRAGLAFSDNTLYGTTSLGGSRGSGMVFSLTLVPVPQLTILAVTLAGPNLVINGANGQSGKTNVTLMSTNVSLPLDQWTPVATNVLNVTGNFIITATNAVDAKAPRSFYILQTQ